MKSPKQVNYLIVALSLIAGTASLAGGGVLIYQERAKLMALWGQRKVSEETRRRQCMEKLKKLEMHVRVMPDDRIRGAFLREDRLILKDPRQAFSHMSIGLLACGGYRLSAFCAGKGCASKHGHEYMYMLLERN